LGIIVSPEIQEGGPLQFSGKFIHSDQGDPVQGNPEGPQRRKQQGLYQEAVPPVMIKPPGFFKVVF
jgi:hypothetical protein